MMKAIQAALKPSDDQSHVRVVCFMTDGYVGNEMEIIAEIQKHPNARVFAFGIGETMASHDVLASLWARARVDDLVGQDFKGLQSENMRADLKDTITQLGIEYRLMTPFTSFVAVEEIVVTDGGQPRRIDVPLESPAGVSRTSDAPFRLGGGDLGFIGQFFVGRRNVRANGGYIIQSGNVGGSVVIMNGGAAAGKLPAPNNGSKEAEELRREKVNSKLHRSVLAVVERVRKKEALTSADEAGFIRNGKAEVQVWLAEKSEANLAKLKELGFEVIVDANSPNLIIGRVSIEKLEALAELTFVSYVSPQVSK